MVRIRLSRTGRKHLQLFRIVAADSRSPRDGKNLEVLGTYNPKGKTFDQKLVLKEDRIKFWIGQGAQPSDRIWNLLRKRGINKSNAKGTVVAKSAAPAAKRAAPAAKAK